MRRLAIPLALLLFGTTASAAELDTPLKVINSVGKEGVGNAAAAKAWAELVKAGPDALLPILNAIDDAKPTAANWLRTAIDAIVEKQAAAGEKFNEEILAIFIRDRKNSPTARTVAFEVFEKQEPVRSDVFLVGFIRDPSLELRRKGVQKHLTLFKDSPSFLQMIFEAARDKDQVESIAKELEKLKLPANITKHYGYITQWALSEDFDNKDGLGFGKAFAPETAVERKGWKAAQSSATYGLIDLNAAVGKKMNAVVYSSAILEADAETPAEIRVASQNAIKIYLNGKEIFAREEYHHGTKMDQHIAKVILTKGKNSILLKVCQNDMPYDWAQVWGFAARVCDATGGSLKLKQRVDDKPVSLGELAPATPKENK